MREGTVVVALRAFWRLGFRLWVCTGLYYRMSRLFWRWPWVRKKNRQIIPMEASLEEVERHMAAGWYDRDGLWGMLDRFTHPEVAYARLMAGERFGDCDEFGLVAACMLRRSQDAKESQVFTVFWTVGWRGRGHNVCAYREAETAYKTWGAIGNWQGGKPFSRYTSRSALAEALVRYRSGNKGRVAGWAAVSRDLRKVLAWQVSRDV